MLLRRLGIVWQHTIGEIAIIVIGVLIAIALDGWNDARIDRRLEKDYLERLAEDLRADTATFSFMEHRVKRKVAALSVADSVLRGQRIVRDTVTFLQALVSGSNFAWNQSKARTTTFQELQMTGNLRLIRSTALRAGIVNYYSAAEGDYDRIRARRTQYGPLTYQLLPRKKEFALDSAAVRGRLNVLTKAIFRSDLAEAIVAERNFAAFILEMNAGMQRRALALLGVIERQSAR